MKIRFNRDPRKPASKSLPLVSSSARNGPLTELKQILVPVDFSGPCRIALDYAVALARRLGAKIRLLHVTAPPLYPGPVGALPVPVEDEAAVRAAIDKLEELAKQAVAPTLLGTALARTGSPDQEILQTVRELKVDLIVLARHGHTGSKHRIIGTTADKVARQAPCRVLIVPIPQPQYV